MSRVRTSSEIIRSYLDFYRVAQPLLDTKPGTVARDLFIDGQADQISRLYSELAKVSNLQSLRASFGKDLDNWAQNIGSVRKRGAKSTVPALLLFDSVDADISINKGDLIFAKNGTSFAVLNSIVITSTKESQYKAVVSKYKGDLDYLGYTEQYGIEIVVEATAFGSQGDISKYSLNSTNIAGVTNVTNVSPGGGGLSAESDSSFKNRILSIFSGSNTGTALGYENTARTDPSVIDVYVVSPGDDLMTRDGTQVSISSNNTRTIVSEGTGGKVDIITYGFRLQENIDSYIYRDKSNTGNPTNSANDYVLGQISSDANKTITRKRLDNLKNKILPAQPINNIVSVVGSLSGPNFKEKTVDSLGRVSGNYELIRDSGVYANSPWGFDRLRWINDRISIFEDKTKVSFNNQDPLTYSDVTKISKITQNINIINENSRVSTSDRTILQLAHKPITSVTRVFNVSTGERYVISNQNPDGTGSVNYTGRIKISGKSLPSQTDILQVDYTWIYEYDSNFDFDNKEYSFNSREVSDSIDWGYSNLVRRERATLTSNGSYLTLSLIHPIQSVVKVDVFTDENATINISSGRLSIVLSKEISNIVSIKRYSDNAELWDTEKNDGTISAFTAYLPTDSSAVFGDFVLVTYNSIDVYETTGSFNNNQITIVPTPTATAGTIVEVTYLANIIQILPQTLLSSLPAIRNVNSFNTNISNSVGCQPYTCIFDGSNISQNIRQAPCNLAITINGSIVPGIITVTGKTIQYVQDVVFVASSSGLTHDLSAAIKSYLNLSSKDSLPSNLSVVRLIKFNKVNTDNSLNVLSTLHEYDILGYSINNNSLVLSESIKKSSLSSTQIKLPDTEGNLDNSISVGDKILVSFYIYYSNDSENIYFTKSGTQYSQKKFAFIDTVSISSGFNSVSSASATISIQSMNQPISKSRYKVYYDYIAPKTNERITITSNYNKLIGDVQLLIENTRPLTADVLVKLAEAILVDITMYIVVTNEFANSSNIVKQNVQDAITSFLNSDTLGQIIDSSDLINTAYTVSGVDRARIIYFNKTGNNGSVLSISASKNQYIRANNVTVVIEER